MFSFIRKFFEDRRRKAAELESLCEALFQRVAKALQEYVDVDKNDRELVCKWLSDYECLLDELNDIGKFKKASSYRLLKLQKKSFDEFRVAAANVIRAIIAQEKRKRADDEYVLKKMNQWAAEQKRQKVNVFKSNNLNRKLGKLAGNIAEIPSENGKCSCCGKNGQKKMLYSSEIEALVVAEQRSKIIRWPLRVYPCPYGKGYHITSNRI